MNAPAKTKIEGTPHPADPWTILDKDKHTGLWDNRNVYAYRAGMPVEWLWSDPRVWLSKFEFDFASNYGEMIRHGKLGIVYLGHPDSFDPSVQSRCRALAARFIRGAKGGLCHTLGHHFDRFNKLGITRAGFLSFPFFATDPPELIPIEQKRAVLEQLRGRMARNLGVTALGIASWDLAERTYGASLVADLKSSFFVIEGNVA